MRMITICCEGNTQHHQYSGYGENEFNIKAQMVQDVELFLQINGIHRMAPPPEEPLETVGSIDDKINKLLERRKLLQLVS